MPSIDRSVTRRTVLQATATAGLAAAGLSATAMSAAGSDEADCCVCWVDVKPGSCPNAINPDSGGVVSVAAGRPNIEPSTAELVPITEACAEEVGFEPAFEECQDYQDKAYAEDCDPLAELLACEAAGADRSASPVRSSSEDIDEDGDQDTVFKFRVEDLELRTDDAYLVLTGEAREDDCTVYGVDSVRVVEGDGGSGGKGDSQGRRGGR